MDSRTLEAHRPEWAHVCAWVDAGMPPLRADGSFVDEDGREHVNNETR